MNLENNNIDIKDLNEDLNNDSEYDSDNDSSLSDEDLSDDDDDEQSEEENITELNNITTDSEPLKKKRGRKCKPKDESQQVEKVQKKRGRKPKIKDLETEKIPKKRGRKPKEKVYSVKELPKTFFEENKNETFILHLPIKSCEINNEYIPIPNNNNNYSIYNDIETEKMSDNNLLPTQVDLLDLKINSNIQSYSNDNKLYQYDNKITDIKYSSLDNNDMNNTINDNSNKDDEYKTNKVIKKNLKNIMYEFINSNDNKTWPESTNIYCWWCCHPFTCTPCAIPEYYKKDKFYVYGCFCSFNCAASYNFSKNDDDIWERYSLLNLMYKKLYNNKLVKINLAPPREILKIFGGYMSIEEFRENSLKNEKVFSVVRPPLISIIPKIEENISNNTKNIKNNFPLINENILNKTHNNLKLKRNKPVTNPNSTLQSFMDLKIV
jgi:hypothetical protein